MALERHSVYYLAGRIATASVGVLALYTFTRILSPADYGRYTVILAIAGLISNLAFEWLRQCLLRFWVDNVSAREQLLGTLGALFLALVAILLLVFVALFALGFETTELNSALVASIGVLACAQSWFEFTLDARRVDLKPVRYSLASFLRAVFNLSIGASAAIFVGELSAVILGIASGYILASLFAMPRWLVGFANIREARAPQISEFVRYGLPLSVTLGFTAILNSADLIMLAMINGSEQAGVYGSAYNLAQYSIGTLLGGLGLAVFPLAVRSYSESDPKTSEDLLGKNLTLMVAVALPATVGLGLVAPILCRLLLGNFDPVQSVVVTVIVAAGIMLAALRSYALDVVFMLARKTKTQASIIGISAIFNVLCNSIMIPLWGAVGAAVSTFLSFGLAFVMSALVGRRYLRIMLRGVDFAKIGLATLIMGLSVWALDDCRIALVGLISNVLFGVIIYSIMLILLNPAGMRDGVFRIYSRRRYL